MVLIEVGSVVVLTTAEELAKIDLPVSFPSIGWDLSFRRRGEFGLEIDKRTQRDHDHRDACGVYPERVVSLEFEASKTPGQGKSSRRGYLRHDYESVSKNSF